MTDLSQLQPSDEWRSCIGELPDDGVLVRFKDEISKRQWTGYGAEIRSVAKRAMPYVWWKLTGIERQKCKS